MPRDTVSAQTLVRRLVQTASADVASTEAEALRDEPDGVHRHRTRVRRLRTVLSVVRRVTDPGETRELRRSLKRWGSTLGEARDAEVRAERADEALTALGIDDADARRRLVGDERAAYRHLHERIAAEPQTDEGRRRTQLVREAGLTLEVEHPDAKSAKVVRRLVRREAKRVSRAVSAADGSLDRFHDVRKAARRLRYLAEAVDAANPGMLGGDVQRLGRAAKRVHKLLGEHRDDLLLADRARRLRARAFTAQESTAPYDAMSARAHDRAEQQLDGLPKAMKKLRKAAKRLR